MTRWLGLLLFVCASCAPKVAPQGKHLKHNRTLFGVLFRMETPDARTNRALLKQLDALAPEMTESLDPDCIWRQPPCTNRNPERTQRVEQMADTFREETLGVFSIDVKGEDGVTRRDFAGLSQGYTLELLKADAPGPWIGDFAGDIYLSGGFTPDYGLGIAEPLLESVKYASVEMKAGWMIAATGTALGGKVRGETDSKTSFQRVVLFATPAFDGARLDAWSTALMAGGPRLLAHLEGLKKFDGQWGYVIFDSGGNVKCSANLICTLDAPPRSVKVAF